MSRFWRWAGSAGYLAVSFGVGVVALAALCLSLFVLLTCAVGIGLLAVPFVAYAVHVLARWDAARAARRFGLPEPQHRPPVSGGVVARARQTLLSPMTYIEMGWLLVRGIIGSMFGTLALQLQKDAILDLVLPLRFGLYPQSRPFHIRGYEIHSWLQAVIIGPLVGMIIAVVCWFLIPRLADGDAWITHKLLTPPARVRLAERVEELTDTRAEALDAHGAELRRIERDLHDGAQARLVSVAMRLGLAERQLAENPEAAEKLILDARTGAEEALTELRDIVRGMYPPILADRGLDGAIAALAARCAVPATVASDSVGRVPAAVEAAAYFLTAEALTNVSRHSGAARAVVRLRKNADMLIVEITDDGHGGADERLGTGLDGIRRRVAALDGRMDLWSPLGGPTVLRVELPCGS